MTFAHALSDIFLLVFYSFNFFNSHINFSLSSFPAVTRVGGNKKGVFTRNRQPKAVAHMLRKRYFALGREVDQCNFPEDLFTYIADVGTSRDAKHDETDL